jgi:hypothetical protein
MRTFLKRTLVEFDGGLVQIDQDFAMRKVDVDVDFKESVRGFELPFCEEGDVVVMVTHS